MYRVPDRQRVQSLSPGERKRRKDEDWDIADIITRKSRVKIFLMSCEDNTKKLPISKIKLH